MPLTVYANSTPEISLEEFTDAVTEIEEKYDSVDEQFSTMLFKNGSEFYYIDGEDFLLCDNQGEVVNAVVNKYDITIPYETVKLYGNHYVEKEYVNRADLEELGFAVEFVDDTAILSKPLQTNRLIVKSRRDINELDSIDSAEGYDDLHILQFDDEESTEEALNYYNNLSYVEYAEPDMIVSIQDIDYRTQDTTSSTDTILYDNHLSWGSEYIGVDDYTDYLGDVSELPEIIVGIIDTGIVTDHEFLADRVIETGVNYSDTGKTNNEKDDNGHGTHVAGIIVDNTTENVKIAGYKVLNSKGSGSTSNICLAIDKAVEDGVDVINMSLGGKGKDAFFTETVQNAISQGVIVCVAAGNSGANANGYSPASIEGCITVAAIDYENEPPYWSNYGSCVDIIAPGVDIYSSYIQTQYDGWYKTLSGTSMATPFVSAASALVLSKHPQYDKDNVLEVLQSNGRTISLPERFEGLKVLYIGTVTEYDRERTSAPVFSLESGYYQDSISVEITCADENAEIYYTTDGTRASKDNGILYTEPVVINKVTALHAAAYSPNKLKSLQTSAQYYLRYLDDESNFEIDEEGTITAYNGNSDYLIVPDTVNGITVTGIGKDVFNKSSIVMIELPDTATHIDEYSFYWCRNLVSFKAKNLVEIGDYALSRNNKLVGFDISEMESIGKYGCTNIPLSEINNEKLTVVNSGVFRSCGSAVNINLPEVTEVRNAAFQFCSRVEEIYLPKVEILGTSAFENVTRVTTMDFPNVIELGSNVFNSTYALETLNIPKYYGPIRSYLFYMSGLKYLNNDNFTEIGDNAFANSKIETLILKNATTAGEKAFYNCYSLKTLYLPAVTEIGYHAFCIKEDETNDFKLLFLPSLVSTQDLPVVNSQAVIYLSEKFSSYDVSWNTDQNCTIVAPKSSYAEEFAQEGFPTTQRTNSMNFVSSDNMANVLGGSIRLSDCGLRFGFSWNNIAELERIADSVEYGFLYEYGETDDLTIESGRKKVATNCIDHDGYTTFNLVFTNIPKANYDTKISARAYVCIDGMYFYSDIITRSFEGVANAVIADDTIDETTKEQVRNILEA